MNSANKPARKLAVVTGGSRGIGAAIIHELARHDFDVLTYARKEPDLAVLKNDLQEHYKSTLSYQLVQASDPLQIEAFARYVLSTGRHIDVLVNNAGMFKPGTLADESSDQFREMMAVNFDSACQLTKHLLPQMKQAHSGHIINISSIAAITAYPSGGSYATAKTALLGYTRNLRSELKTTGIRVTAVLPGATLTDSWAGAGLPDSRFMPAEDVAKVVWACIDLSERTVVEEILLRPQLGDI